MGAYEIEGNETLDMNFSEYFVSILSRKVILKRLKNGDIWDP